MPRKPDIVMRRRRTVVFVNGCFWHRREGCRCATTPGSNAEYWRRETGEQHACGDFAAARIGGFAYGGEKSI